MKNNKINTKLKNAISTPEFYFFAGYMTCCTVAEIGFRFLIK